LTYISALLDSGAANLALAGSGFPFALPPDFAGFDTPATFGTFNRGLAAKVDLELAFRPLTGALAGDGAALLAAAQTALTASFMDTTKALDVGPAHSYAVVTGDAQNGLFDGDTASTNYVANPRVRAEADAGDLRVTRKTAVSAQRSEGGEASTIVFLLYQGPTTPTKLLMNKELILLQAEVYWGQGNLPFALAWADFIRRTDGGLATDTTTVTSAASVLNRILHEKRYSLLWQSGDRWIDARMFGKLDSLPPPAGLGAERGYAPLPWFPIPQNEQNARGGSFAPTVCTSGP